jgi:hypothetical protein
VAAELAAGFELLAHPVIASTAKAAPATAFSA